MVSDTATKELHEFAHVLEIPRIAFQGDHYDLHEIAREAAINLGARRVTSREIVGALRATGLRRGPSLVRRGLSGVVNLPTPALTTDRLILRQWQPNDVAALAEIDARLASDRPQAAIDRHAVTLALRGFGEWAVTFRDSKVLIGSLGLTPAPSGVFERPMMQITGYIASAKPGMGLGQEGCRHVLEYGFSTLELDEIVAVISVENERALSGAHNLGMQLSPGLPLLRGHRVFLAKRSDHIF